MLSSNPLSSRNKSICSSSGLYGLDDLLMWLWGRGIYQPPPDLSGHIRMLSCFNLPVVMYSGSKSRDWVGFEDQHFGDGPLGFLGFRGFLR